MRLRRRDTVRALLRRWEADGWEVDHERQEVVVDGTWLPVDRLPYVLSNYAADLADTRNEIKRVLLERDTEPHSLIKYACGCISCDAKCECSGECAKDRPDA